jgi:hypothetical protein
MYNDEVERFEVDGLTVRIETDRDPESPRDRDNLGTMACFHRRYRLGDTHGSHFDDFAEEMITDITDKGGVVLPLYLYDHSGITISTSPFSCPWDSGQVGFIYVTADRIRKEYSAKRISKKTRELATSCLEQEVKTYDEYLTGQVYGYIVEDADGKELDSCWGHYGLKWAKEAATDAAKSAAAHIAKLTAQGETAAQKWGAEHNA